MLDVAMAMDYLHCGQTEPVIHCDLKPSNILLDEDMVAHVADFGIAKILSANKTETQTSTFGTFGYIAPGKVKKKDRNSTRIITKTEIDTDYLNALSSISFLLDYPHE